MGSYKGLYNNLDAENKAKLIEHYHNLGEDKKSEWIEKSIKKNGGVRIMLEYWSDIYPKSDEYPNLHVYADVVGTYPISKKDNVRGIKEFRHVCPKLNESFRCELKFPSTEETKESFDNYVAYFQQPELADCI